MTEDPLNRYKDLMNSEKAPDHLPAEVLKRAREQSPGRTSHADAARLQPPLRRTATKRRVQAAPGGAPAASTASASLRRPRTWGFAIAACAALALGVGLLAGGPLAATLGRDSQGMPQTAASGLPSPFDFTVKAYAGTTDTLLSFGANGEIVFDRNTEAGLPSKVDNHYQNEGYFTGCMFRIEADDVTNITASIDRGQLYRYTAEEFAKSSDPDRWKAALNWKSPQDDGPFSSYDYVQPQSANDGLDRTNPNKLCRIAYSKLLGSRASLDVDVAAGESASSYNLGLWTNLDYPDAEAGQDPFAGPIDTLDGAKLTVALTYANGSTSTKVIELHSADMKTQAVPAEYDGTSRMQVLPEIVDLSTMTPEQEKELFDAGYSTVHSLYGTVVDESHTPAVGNA